MIWSRIADLMVSFHTNYTDCTMTDINRHRSGLPLHTEFAFAPTTLDSTPALAYYVSLRCASVSEVCNEMLGSDSEWMCRSPETS
jgi:hypothetical protein